MKFIFAIVLFAVVSCNNSGKNEMMHMPGAYNMLSQSVDDGKRDTTYTNLKEFKIYTDDYMMYVYINPNDSVSGFGIGSYTADSGKVVEDVIYGASDTSSNSNPTNFTLIIEKTNNGYKQIIPEMMSRGRKLKLTENHESVGTAVKTPLDGAWKKIKSYTIKGKDTVMVNSIQYKAYYAGHFMFGHNYRDSVNKFHTGIGYGDFEMIGQNKVKEFCTTSTYYQARERSFDLDIVMNGPDEYQQTITETNGDKNVEVYQRLKK